MKKLFLIFTLAFTTLAFFSCNRETLVSSVKKETLFSLNYGSFENQLNLFNLSSTGTIDTAIAMKNGFFYITNGEAQKLLEINSYGDLLTLYYNSETTVAPSLEKAENVNNHSSKQNIGASTRKAVDYAFNSPGLVTVDNRQCIYVTETLPRERQEIEDGKALRQVVLRFNSDSFVDYIGQNGPGGTPFPYIKNIYTTSNNNLVVVCIVPDGLEVFYFSSEGRILHNILVKAPDVPNPYKADIEFPMFVTVENIVPDTNDKVLWVKVDYSVVSADEVSKVQSGIDYYGTLVFPMNIASGNYGKAISVPPFEESFESDFTRQVYKQPYDFVGATNKGWLFFSIPTEEGYIIQVVDTNQVRTMKRLIKVDHSQVVYSSFNLSSDGIISALLARRDKAEVVWWRTDLFIDSLIKS